MNFVPFSYGFLLSFVLLRRSFSFSRTASLKLPSLPSMMCYVTNILSCFIEKFSVISPTLSSWVFLVCMVFVRVGLLTQASYYVSAVMGFVNTNAFLFLIPPQSN